MFLLGTSNIFLLKMYYTQEQQQRTMTRCGFLTSFTIPMNLTSGSVKCLITEMSDD